MTEVVTGPDGVRLAVRQAGNPGAPAIVLLHGWAQHHICWAPLIDRLKDRYFIVAPDLRGHGASDKPTTDDAYSQDKPWADDVQALLDAFGIDRPVLVGWSYGARVIASYVAMHGDARLGGVVPLGGVLGIGAAREDWMIGAASPALDKDLYTDDQPRRLAATARFVGACTAQPLDRQTFGEMVGANMLCPAHVRRAMFQADCDIRPIWARLTVPGLVIHGAQDTIVTPATGKAATDSMPNGRFLSYDGVAHAPQLEAPDRLAADLAAFVDTCQAHAP